MQLLRRMVTGSRLFNFNQVERDRWIQEQAGKLAPGSRVLDVGAGSCPYKKFLSHCSYESQDAEQLPSTELRDREGYGSITYRSDATAIPVPDRSFDAVLCTEMLEHVPEPIKVIREISRILKPGGKLILTAPLGSGIHQAPYHYYGGYTPYWYERFLGENGFVNVDVTGNRGFFKHYSQESLRFIQLAAPWRISIPLLFRILWSPIWLSMLFFQGIVIPVLCHFLDRGDKKRDFTIGYHVTATRGT